MPSIIQKHKFGSAFMALAALLVLAATALPWKSLLENRLTGLLEAKGFTHVQMTLAGASQTHLVLKDIAFKKQDIGITANSATLNGAFNAKNLRWEGEWEVNNTKISNAPTQLPTLNGNGTLSLRFNQATIKGRFFDTDNAVHLTFTMNAIFTDPNKSTLTVMEFMMPWSGGKLSAQNINIPFGDKTPLDIDLKVDQISADTLLQQLTGNRATATGKISGTLPVTIMPDSGIFFREGQLQADAPGILTISPDVIPGDNAQVTLVREILKDFHYTSLSLQLDSGKDNRSEIQMKLEGKNPEVQQGRAIKMNVNLNGDVLGFAQQNLLWLTDPKKIIERGKNAKP